MGDNYFFLTFNWQTIVSTLLDLQLPTLTSDIFFPFLNHQIAVFFFFLLFYLPSSVLQRHQEEGNFFLKYNQCNWLLYVLFSLILSRTSSLVTFSILSSPFSSCTTFRSSPNIYAPIFSLSKFQSYTDDYYYYYYYYYYCYYLLN